MVVGQGAGVLELLAAFDLVVNKHEGMAADLFNDDGTYKAGIVQVIRGGDPGWGT
jgi:hypothetical protein